MADTRSISQKGSKLTPGEQEDLLGEVKRLLDKSGIKAKIEVPALRDIHGEIEIKDCDVCIACTCMICV